MLLDQQEVLSAKHLIEHFQNLTPLSIDHSCTICYPQPNVVTIQFKNFWNWIETYFLADTYTLYSVAALPVYLTAFQNDPNTHKSQQVVDLAVKLLLSITYFIRPEPFTDLISFFLNFTYRTKYFQNPITAEIINQFNLDLTTVNHPVTFATYQNPIQPIVANIPPPQPPPQVPPPQHNQLNMDAAQMRELLVQAFGNDGTGANPPVVRNVGDLLNQNLNATTQLLAANQARISTRIVDVPTFHGRDDEDPED